LGDPQWIEFIANDDVAQRWLGFSIRIGIEPSYKRNSRFEKRMLSN
jgi:hypothetical protein